MRNDRHLALKLRKSGKSYGKISKELNIPKSTLNNWLGELPWSKNIKEKLMIKAIQASKLRIKRLIKTNRDRWEKRRENSRKEASKDFENFKLNPLFIAGIMLYWGEGDQNLKYPVRLSNVNYKMIVLFVKFLIEICHVKIEDIYFSLFIYPDIKEEECKIFWVKKLKANSEQFDKIQVIYGKHPTKRLENGICAVRVAKSTGLKEKILVWINLLSECLVSPSYKMRV